MKDKRKHRRLKLKENPQVFDPKSRKLIGNILDISESGFKMVTLGKLEQGKEYLLKIALPSVNGEKKHVNVKARVQWCSKNVDFGLSTLGCYLVQVGISGRLDLAIFMFNSLENKTEPTISHSKPTDL